MEVGGYDLLLAHPCQIETASSLLTYLSGHLPTVYYCQEPPRRLYESSPPRPYEGRDLGRRQILDRYDPLPKLYHATLKRTDRHNTRRADLVLVNSGFMQKSVSQIYGIAATVSYHAVDTDWFRPLSLPKKQMILSVGSLTPLKGFDFLIQAVATLPTAERPPLVIASNFQNPPERDYLAQLAADLGVELELLGNIDDETLRRLYNEAAVTAYTPHREPFGLVPVEAMACGAAVVAIREGGVPESVVHEQTGLLAERDTALFGAALRRILADPELAATFGRNGRAEALRRWTWDQAIERLETHLNAAAQNH
jgi:glycosyltransferase involved in cell wall biosynthesis